MKITLLGKTGSVTNWLEGCAAGLRDAGHEVQICSTNRGILPGPLRAARIAAAIQRFRPELILSPNGYLMPLPVLDHVRALPKRPKLVAWVGDVFVESDRAAAARYDAIAYTDSFLVAEHARQKFPGPAFFLPHAANPRLAAAAAETRTLRMVFAGNPTPNRIELFGKLAAPIAIYGPGWQKFPNVAHDIHARRVGITELQAIYARHLAVLNIRHGANTVNGLNQRGFDPYLAGAPVVSDPQPDLKNCFDIGTEVLVYHSADELNEIYARLQREPALAATIAAAGRRRVLRDHQYANRLTKLLEAL